MKKIINLLLISFIAAGLTACWSEDIPEAGAARHQVTDLTATPGDEEVQLAWSLPEGWNPTDFIVYYTNTDSETVTLRTGGEMNCTVGGLVNDTQYTFYVQAVYGKLVSNYVAAVGRPATTRFPVTDLTVDAGDSFVSLAWTKPATTVLSYTLSYYNEDAPDNVEQQTLDKDATSVTLDKLTNDKNYYFSLTANYEKGASEPATAKAMPTLAIPYILDRDQAAQNQPITFSFNTQDYPTATDVKWTFPGNVVKEGTVVKYGLGTIGTQTVKLNAMIEAGEIKAEEAKMGYVGAFTYAEVVSGYTSFFLGARSVCPSVTMDVTFTGSWYDETAEKEGANKLIANGCVLISQHADSMGAPTACETAGVPNVSYNGSTQSACPNTFIVSSRIDWAPYYEYAITAAMNGEAIDADWTGTLATGSVVLTDVNTTAAAEGTQEAIDAVKAELENGTRHVFDCSTFTVKGETLTSSKADVDTDPNYTPDTEAIVDGYFAESTFRSAPYFDLQIDGINLLDTNFGG